MEYIYCAMDYEVPSTKIEKSSICNYSSRMIRILHILALKDFENFLRRRSSHWQQCNTIKWELWKKKGKTAQAIIDLPLSPSQVICTKI